MIPRHPRRIISDGFCRLFWIVLVLYSVGGQNCPYDSIVEDSNGCVEGQKFAGGKSVGPDVKILQNDQYPYIVSLQTLISGNHNIGNGCYKHFCGGTMIAPNLILTAAHCFDTLKSWYPGQKLSGQEYYVPKDPIYAAISPQCRHLSNEKFGRMEVNQIFIYPQYFTENNVPKNDVAILQVFRLKGQFYQGPLVQLVGGGDTADVQKAQAIGYGEAQPSHVDKYIVYPLHGAELQLIDQDFCEDLLDLEDDISSTQLDYLSMVCYYNKDADTCGGDSGGPLLEDNGVQFALVSWGPGGQCSKVDRGQPPGVYVRLAIFMDWIQLIVNQFGYQSTQTDTVEQIEEANALMAFKNSLTNNFILSSWTGTNACNNWLGISCLNNRVIIISLGETNWNLDEISKSDRRIPLVQYIQTSIPDQWSVLEKLQRIQLGETGVTGSIPVWLSQLQDLEVFDVEEGKLQGTLPVELSTLSNLKLFYAKGNALKGPLPVQYSTLASLKYISLWKNSLTGTLPQQYSEFVDLISLYLERNELSGTVPPQYSSLGQDPYIIIFPQNSNLLCLDEEHKDIVDDNIDVIKYC